MRVLRRVRVSAAEGMRAALLEGLGLAVCPTWLFAGEVGRGAIERVLEACEPASSPIQAVYPSRRLVPPRLRAFEDYREAEFRRDARLRPEG